MDQYENEINEWFNKAKQKLFVQFYLYNYGLNYLEVQSLLDSNVLLTYLDWPVTQALVAWDAYCKWVYEDYDWEEQ